MVKTCLNDAYKVAGACQKQEGVINDLMKECPSIKEAMYTRIMNWGSAFFIGEVGPSVRGPNLKERPS